MLPEEVQSEQQRLDTQQPNLTLLRQAPLLHLPLTDIGRWATGDGRHVDRRPLLTIGVMERVGTRSAAAATAAGRRAAGATAVVTVIVVMAVVVTVRSRGRASSMTMTMSVVVPRSFR